MRLEDHIAEQSLQRTQCHKNVKAMRAAALITDSEHEPLPPCSHTTWNGPRTAERHASENVATRVDSVCADSSTYSSVCRKMLSGLTTFFLQFVGFVFFGVTGVAVGG